jgi:hypothetical protein
MTLCVRKLYCIGRCKQGGVGPSPISGRLQLDLVALTGQGCGPALLPIGRPVQTREGHGEKGLAESLSGGQAADAFTY